MSWASTLKTHLETYPEADRTTGFEPGCRAASRARNDSPALRSRLFHSDAGFFCVGPTEEASTADASFGGLANQKQTLPRPQAIATQVKARS